MKTKQSPPLSLQAAVAGASLSLMPRPLVHELSFWCINDNFLLIMISVIHGLCCFGYSWTFDRSSRTCIKNQTISSRKVSTLFMQYFLFPYSYNLFIDFSVSTVKILPRLVPYINKGEDALYLLEKAIVRLPSTRWLRGTLSSSCASLCSSPSTRNLSLFASASLRSARSFAQVSSAVFAWCCLLSLW